MKIEVTQTHIDRGRVGNAFSCPVALAIREVLLDTTVAVAGPYANLKRKGDCESVHFAFSSEVEQWIRDFDLDRKVLPFSFELEGNNNGNESEV